MKLLRLFTTVLFSLLFSAALQVVSGLPVLYSAPVFILLSYVVPVTKGALSVAFVTQNNINEREVFGNAVAALQNAFFDTPGFNAANYKLTQSYLRVEQALVAGITQYRFPVLVTETSPTIFNTEKRLNLQDSFVVASIGVFVSAPSSATATAFLPQTFPNPTLFTTTTAADLETLYNTGSLEIKVNNNVLVPDWDILRHHNNPGANGYDTLNTGATPVAPIPAQSGIDGFFPMEPNIVFVGAKNTKLTINLAGGIATVLANSRITMIFRGILAQNTTVVS